MVLGTKTRLAKRKLEVQEVRKEKQTVTSKKHDKKCFTNNDNSGKDVLEKQLKSLQEKIDQLEIERNESETLIKELKTKLADLENKKQVKIISAESQTEYEFQDIPCKDCIYVASCAEELDFHVGDAHYDEDDDGPSESVSQSPYNCNICGRRNSKWGELRSHLKIMHAETVRPCKFFLLDKCDFPENVCWFMHTKPDTTFSQQTLKE